MIVVDENSYRIRFVGNKSLHEKVEFDANKFIFEDKKLAFFLKDDLLPSHRTRMAKRLFILIFIFNSALFGGNESEKGAIPSESVIQKNMRKVCEHYCLDSSFVEKFGECATDWWKGAEELYLKSTLMFSLMPGMTCDKCSSEKIIEKIVSMQMDLFLKKGYEGLRFDEFGRSVGNHVIVLFCITTLYNSFEDGCKKYIRDEQFAVGIRRGYEAKLRQEIKNFIECYPLIRKDKEIYGLSRRECKSMRMHYPGLLEMFDEVQRPCGL